MTSAKSRCVVFLMTFVMAQCVPLDFTTSRYSGETVELHDNRSLPLLLLSNSHTTPQIFDISNSEEIFSLHDNLRDEFKGRRSKSPRSQQFHVDELIRNLRAVDFRKNDSFLGNSTDLTKESGEDESRKFSNKKKPQLYSNFERKPSNDKINKTQTTNSNPIKPINVSKNSIHINNTKSKTTNSKNSSLYSNFVTNPIRHTQTLKPLSNNNISSFKNQNINNNKNVAKKPGVFEIRVPKPTITPKPTKFQTITNKPIIIELTKVPQILNSFQTTRKPTVKISRTPGWVSKIKSTTPIPTTSTKTNNFGWPNNKIKNKKDWNRYKNYTELHNSVTSKKPNSNTRRKPTLTSSISNNRNKPIKPNKVKYVPKRGHKPTLEEIKQNWYESGVPYPNPMPEISSNSPTFALPPIDTLPIEEDLEAVQVDAAENNPITNALSTFNLDMRPAGTNLKDTIGSASSGCPTVHISSSVLSPQQRQECSDLNLVINSHFHQNTASDRTPTIDTYQAENPEEDVPVEAVEDPVEEVGQAEADLPVADGAAQFDPVQADSAGGTPGTGGTGGSGANGGNGGNGGDGSSSGLGWPDIKGMLDAVDWLGNKFGYLFSFLRNPYLYLIPAALFFLLGFFLILALFPWWIPLLFLFVGIKAKHKPNVAHHKHIHKPIHHPDGWFWNQNTKTWENVQDFLHRRRVDNANLNHIPEAINQFGRKYGFNNLKLKSIKTHI
ncbi:general transcriptional corepressor trfA-like isoform X1 [Harmonia axyridis]|uniref:general transcriptional corepressor trfA-like isoform X1 n=1 Tax=Harmonia axyridis TaxID=115357 RepID=UPI001E2778C1|nr:general transcriptional corepressor trfA-like isoform X1 [Harmonia axyridis]